MPVFILFFLTKILFLSSCTSSECSKLIETFNERAKLLQEYDIKLSNPEEVKGMVPIFTNTFKNICNKFDEFDQKLRCAISDTRILRPDVEKNTCDLFTSAAEFHFLDKSKYRLGSIAEGGALLNKVPGPISSNDFEKKLNVFCEEVNSHYDNFLCELNVFEAPKASQYSITHLKNICRLQLHRITLLKND